MTQPFPSVSGIPDTVPLFVEKIFAKSRLQKKMLKSWLETRDALYWKRLEEFSDRLLRFLDSKKVSLDYVVDAYLKMCQEMLKEQIHFKRTGEYSTKTAVEAHERIHFSQPDMTSYMFGLAISQFLWPNHYGQYDFFIGQSAKLPNVNSYLEIGPGHGLFLVEALHLFPNATMTAVDISPTSIQLSEALVNFIQPGNKCQFVLKDVNQINSGSYDYIVMCELLEHLDRPSEILKKIYALLQPGGHCFVTTCANAPAIDHVYLYHDVAHIRRHLHDAGFVIAQELALPVGNDPPERWSPDKVEINYSALLRKG